VNLYREMLFTAFCSAKMIPGPPIRERLNKAHPLYLAQQSAALSTDTALVH